jgi:hypothetical protein
MYLGLNENYSNNWPVSSGSRETKHSTSLHKSKLLDAFQKLNFLFLHSEGLDSLEKDLVKVLLTLNLTNSSVYFHVYGGPSAIH